MYYFAGIKKGAGTVQSV